MKTVTVGGVAAGASTGARLRRPDESTEIAVLERDQYVSFAKCRPDFGSYIAYCVLKQNGFDVVAFLSGGMMTYHGYHRTSLAVGKGGMPMVTRVEDALAQRPGALEHV